MAKYLLQNDTFFSGAILRAGKIIDDEQYDLASLVQMGALLVPLDAATQAISDRLAAARSRGLSVAINPSVPSGSMGAGSLIDATVGAAPEATAWGNLTGAPVDHLVVGLGTSGAPLARFLSEDMTTSVVALEAGDNFATDPLVLNPFGDDAAFGRDPKYHWPRMVEATLQPPPTTSNVRLYTEGKMWGGSSGHNAGRAVRGSPDVYDAWGAVNPQWNYVNVRPVMQWMESFTDDGYAPNPAQRGFAGPLFIIQEPPALDPLNVFLVSLNTAAAIATVDDYNDPDSGDCVLSATELFADPNTFERSFSASALLPPTVVTPGGAGVGERRLTIVSRAIVQKVLFDMSGPVPRAIGVQALVADESGSRFVNVLANNVHLCAGAIADPAILQRSGIGDAAMLGALGIPVVVDNPNVGANLQTHYAPFTRIPTDPLNLPPFQAVVSFSDLSGTNLPAPDGVRRAQFVSYANMVGPDLVVDSSNALLRTTTAGTVQISSADPTVDPTVRFHIYEGLDLASAVALLKVWANVSLAYTGNMPILPSAALYPLAEYGAGGGLAADDSELEAYAIGNSQAANHACGTCRMAASAATGVVDGNLRVFGVEGLSVCSNAIQPSITTGNTAYPAYVIGLLKAKIEGGETPY